MNEGDADTSAPRGEARASPTLPSLVALPARLKPPKNSLAKDRPRGSGDTLIPRRRRADGKKTFNARPVEAKGAPWRGLSFKKTLKRL